MTAQAAAAAAEARAADLTRQLHQKCIDEIKSSAQTKALVSELESARLELDDAQGSWAAEVAGLQYDVAAGLEAVQAAEMIPNANISEGEGMEVDDAMDHGAKMQSAAAIAAQQEALNHAAQSHRAGLAEASAAAMTQRVARLEAELTAQWEMNTAAVSEKWLRKGDLQTLRDQLKRAQFDCQSTYAALVAHRTEAEAKVAEAVAHRAGAEAKLAEAVAHRAEAEAQLCVVVAKLSGAEDDGAGGSVEALAAQLEVNPASAMV